MGGCEDIWLYSGDGFLFYPLVYVGFFFVLFCFNVINGQQLP